MQYSITTRRKNKGYQYIISYKDEQGNWKQKSKQGFPGSKEAKAAAHKKVRELEETLKSKAKLNKEYEGKTFKEFTKMYIEHIKLFKEENSIATYEFALKKFHALDDMVVSEIESADIQNCIDNMIKEKLAAATIRLYLVCISSAFEYAIKTLKMVTSNPAKDIEIKAEKSQSTKKALTQAELSDLLSKIKNPNHYLISLIASKCGLRIGEILGLTWDNIDLKNAIMHVKQQWKKKPADEDTEGYKYDFGALKSKNSKRDVPIPKDVLAALKKCPVNINGRLFNYKSITAISTTLRATYLRAGYDISVHELRHTYATTLIANRADFKSVAYLMGHDVTQTEKVYSHVNKDMMKNITELINKIL